MDKLFFITVDTEGDNLWDWHPGEPITTENANYISRFQNTCEKYGFKPVYLINYEMAKSQKLNKTLSQSAELGLCEIGMHLHAWNTPPEYSLKGSFGGLPYITEYPKDVIYEKHDYLMKLIYSQFGTMPVSYRAGRWSTNSSLFEVLNDLGFHIDCSVVPQVDQRTIPGFTVSKGNDYRNAPAKVVNLIGDLWEVPMTTRFVRSFGGDSMKHRIKNIIKGKYLWLRPAVQTVEEMKQLIDIVSNEGINFLDFMVHSSELMPGCSPYCKTEYDIEIMYSKMEAVFNYAISQGYCGYTLKQYYEDYLK